MKRARVLFGCALTALFTSAALADDLSGSPMRQLLVAQVDSGEPAPPVEVAPESVEPQAEPLTVATVHVIAENIESSEGTVWMALCDASLSVEGCPYKLSVPASPGFVELTFDDIPPGQYAVVGYHDVNDDGEFGKLLGVPREPYALSAAAGDMLVPTFDDAKVAIAPGENALIIRMKRMEF